MYFSFIHDGLLEAANITFTFDLFLTYSISILSKDRMQIAVVGGGAAGFFAAIQCAALNPGCEVTILEKSSKVLAKVKVSGGGRCNVTHACYDAKQLIQHYPRGNRQLHSLFSRFGVSDTVQWFESHGVKLKAEHDGRMFPVTDNSQTIIDCLLQEAQKRNIALRMNCPVKEITPLNHSGFEVVLPDDQKIFFHRILIATGGCPQEKGFDWLKKLGHRIVPPVPSLFSFNIREKKLTSMMGLAVPEATLRIKDHPFEVSGPVLITHWGLSGPAVLKLSSQAARVLAELNYRFCIYVNWAGGMNEEKVRREIATARAHNAARKIQNIPLFYLPRRLWEYLAAVSGIDEQQQWAGLSKEQTHGLVNALCRHEYSVDGKTTFKEEFVTCGGVALSDIDMKTMESKRVKGLYFAGEVLDIDAVTGGFNFQAAWSGGYVAGTEMASGF